MIFNNKDKWLSEDEVLGLEKSLGVEFPAPLRTLFVENNGGEPEPYVYQDDTVFTVVSETLPLISSTDRHTAIEVYNDLVIDRKLVKTSFFPFAVDAGGDYFFVDLDSSEAYVYFFKSDSFPDSSKGLVDLHLDLESFWLELQPEEE